MKLPASVKASRDRFAAKFPVPQGVSEEDVRQWTQRLAEQIDFDVPTLRLGLKRADPGRPVCKDCLAQDGPLIAWDMLTGAGTGHPTLNDDPDSIDIADQVFVPVSPTNHVGGMVNPPPVIPGQPPPAGDSLPLFMRNVRDDLGRKEQMIIRLQETLDQIQQRIDILAEPLTPPQPPSQMLKPPKYTGTIFGQRLTLTPVEEKP